jgi:uncharacterized membrane protein YccC
VRKPARRPAASPPAWLVEVVRPVPAPLPWAMMIRAALAVCGPLALGLALDKSVPGLLAAMGGLLGTVADRDGSYPARLKRMAAAGFFGGAAGLVLGGLVHGHGWLAVAVLVLVAGLSAVLTAAGATVSLTGLQLLVYTTLGTGPLGTLRPWWWPPMLLLAGVAWSMLLLAGAWLVMPLAPEQRSTAAVYRAIADLLRAAGTPGYPHAHQALATALNRAWDDLAARRARISGQDPDLVRVAALLRQTHPLTEAAVTLVQEGTPPPPGIIDTIEAIADGVQYGTPVSAAQPAAGRTVGSRALVAAVSAAADLASGRRPPGGATAPRRPGRRERLRDIFDETVGGHLTRIFAVRLMLSVGVAALVSQAFPVQRSYWVVLTVAIVLRPDFGSVFARALQRGLGTVAGAVLGAVILVVVPPGPLLLIPCAVFAALLPYGRARNWGLFTTFLTPLVVILIDLLAQTGWALALDRLADTLLGCAVVLLVGYAPWPSSWHAHLPERVVTALDSVARYTEQALPGNPGRSALRRRAYRALSDLRTEFQRTLAEPPAVSRRTARLWPAMLALEQVTDAVTSAAVQGDMTGQRPPERAARPLAAALRGLAGSARAGQRPPPLDLPDDPGTRPVAQAIADVQRALAGEDGR